ncbi:up-regulator of cell proliferation isoform X2 [Danio rerio]|uniref:Up-regulator of cell proliferation isoform X2 n=1 Tax=Danio rerio TaxID=7955 RepID=A0A8M9PB17_DANRE|nr:up-regulator of cell proliferation isoform X2 [Danio rerio]|eukprot:XP_021323773.1 up-regulator of cell proliferation isoform X2 [Danio rerio]
MDQWTDDDAMDTSLFREHPSNSEENVKPVEEEINLKPDDNQSENSSHTNMDHGDPDLTVTVFGCSEAVQFGRDNILLGEEQLSLSAEYPITVPDKQHGAEIETSLGETNMLPLGSLEQTDKGQEQKENVKPVEEEINLKPDDNQSENSSHTNMDHGDPDLTVTVFGCSEAVQFGRDNILLGEEQLSLSAEYPITVPVERKISEHQVSVINMIGSHNADLKTLSHYIGQLSENEIHAFIFVVRLGQLTDTDEMGIEWLQRTFGDRVLSFVIILFTYEQEEECDSIIDDLKNNSVLEQLLEKCGRRNYTCSKLMNNQSEITELMDRIKYLFSDNNQQCYTREMYRSSLGDKQHGAEIETSLGETNMLPLGSLEQTDKGQEQKENVKPVEEEINLKPDDNQSENSSHTNMDHGDPDLTVTVFGCSEAVQFGRDNILLGEEQLSLSAEYPITVPVERKISEHQVSVINMIGSHNADLKTLSHYIGQLSENEIHAFIFVVRLGQLTDTDEMGIEWLQRTFGDRVLSFVIILFTYEQEEECDSIIDDLKNNSVLEQLLEKCGRRNYTCSKLMNNQSEITELMNRIKYLFSHNNQQSYTREMYRSSLGDKQHGAEIETSLGETNMLPLGSLEQTDKGQEQKLDAEQLIERIHLEDKHRKLKTLDFLKPIVQSQETCAENELASVFLHKLMMMDYKARSLQIIENNEQQHKTTGSNDLSGDVGNAFDIIFGKSAQPSDYNKTDTVDLMDVQMAIFHCADSFLKQLIVTKLSQCQYALPLLVPNPFTQQIEFPLWTFRQINKSWKTTDNTGKVLSKFQPVYRAETPMVAFFRFGPVSSSKSQLMNNLINEKHNTFFHRNCPGSSRTRVMMDGLVEIAWYCPSGEKTDRFTQCVAFCNLHGDAAENDKHILTEMASVNVVIVPQLDKNDKSMTKIENFMKDSKPFICLLCDNDSPFTKLREGKYRIGLKDRNQSVVFEEIRKAVNDGILSYKSSSIFKLEDVAKHTGIRVDEDKDVDLSKGKKAAQQMMSLLKYKDQTQIKESFLPLQGHLWHQWCQKNKELHRPTLGQLNKGRNLEQNNSSKQSEMQKIREQQFTTDLSQFIQIFIQKLKSPVGNEVAYFLKWLAILLDDYTTENLSALLLEYDEKWSTVLNLKQNHDQSQQLRSAQDKLERVSEKLQAATFGLEHIMREIGQIYESYSSVKRNKRNLQTFDYSSLPSLAAEMMISGFPLELMDGDAAHVPLIWVTAVLDSLIQKLGDKRVYVLSVLGIQSSGKSTMLNAMFGLQFAVSAGRCTRGAFMQLVRVSEEMKARLEVDYILVVDTEGLRALELAGRSTRNHDNEMATFVVGLGNMTLINIFGENTAEMQDILQIVVQAFMRMKKIKLNPSCMFVHQNVSDVTAGEKNMEGRRRLQEKLDEMTKLAAKEEDCDTEFFSEVIAFDVKNDVKYFAQLWEGSPPMAPPNPNYSRNIQDLKSTILSKAAHSSGITLSQFKMRINDLWTALLNENFVFSFKNTLEIATYRRLETKYSDWTWSLRSAMMSIEDKFYIRIANGELTVQDNDLLSDIQKTKKQVDKSMRSYFEEDRDKDILCQWQNVFETRINNLHDDLVKGTKRKLDEAIEQKKAREKLDQKRTEYENTLFSRSKELALSLRSTGTAQKNLNEEFNTMWSKWVNEIIKDIPPVKGFDFWADVIQILSENHELTLVNEQLQKKDYERMDRWGDYCDYIIPKKHLERSDETESSEKPVESSMKSSNGILNWFGQKLMSGIEYLRGTSRTEEYMSLNPEFHYSVKNLTEKVIQKTEMIMNKAPVGTRGYNNSFIQEITDCVKKSVQNHQSMNQKYTLKREYTIDLSLHVCDLARQRFTELHLKFREANDPRIYLEKQKTQYGNIFEKYYKGATTTTILSEFICSRLEESILQAVYNKTAIALAAQMRSDIQALCGNRPDLEKHILKHLAEKEDFDEYMKYIHSPQKHFKQFIKNEVKTYFTKQNVTVQNIFKGNLKEKEQIVSNAVKAATVEVKSHSGDGNMWFRSFSKTLTDELKLTGNSCVDLNEIKDLDFLEDLLSKDLKERMKTIQSSINQIKIEQFQKRPDEILIEHFCQCCWVQCPFCNAICTNTMEDHSGDHCVPFHRSVGLKGWYYRGTTNLAIEICTTAVSSDDEFYPNSSDSDDETSDDSVPWKEYRKGGPEYARWSITPDKSELPYWKWFVCRFQKDLEAWCNKTFQGRSEIPDEWKKYTKSDALESVDKYL